jgi:hypothetical protein
MSLVEKIVPAEKGRGENTESRQIQENSSLSGKQKEGQVSTLKT